MRTNPASLALILAISAPLQILAIPQNIFNQGGFFNGAVAMPLEAFLVDEKNWGGDPLPGPWQEDSNRPGHFSFDGPEPLFGLPTSTLTASYASDRLQQVVASFPKDAHSQLARSIAHFLGIEPQRPAKDKPSLFQARGLSIEIVTLPDATWVKISRAGD
jgi:hypothetical protein